MQYIWKVPIEATNNELYTNTNNLFELAHLKYCTRAMKKLVQVQFNLNVTMKPAVFREMYHIPTGDASASASKHQELIDQRVKILFKMGTEEETPA